MFMVSIDTCFVFGFRGARVCLVGLCIEISEEEKEHDRVGEDPVGEENWIVAFDEE